MGRRSFRRGELLLVVLKVLEERPLPEGEVLDELDRLLGDQYRLSARAVLVALAALEAEGLVKAEAPHGSAVYRVTREGANALARRADVPVLARLQEPAAAKSHHPVSHALERVAVLFTDVVGSTELLDRLGDDAAHHVRRRHFALLRDAVTDHGGREVKSLGDGLMVVFASAGTALACGVSMQRAVAASEDPLELRVGVASGEAVCEDGDYFGRPVVVARRLCDAASGGEVLVSEPAPGPVAGAEAREIEPLRLKGLSEPVAASTVRMSSLALIA
jgi:class 3 adenylate cyclase